MRFLVCTVFVLLLSNGVNAQALWLDTVCVNKGQPFRVTAIQESTGKVLLGVTYNSNTILNDTLDEGLFAIEFPDFNRDGCTDIELVYGGNNFYYYLYLFDTASKVFKYVENFDYFPAAVQLKANAKYYYSYHRAGCADFNWVSDFFAIENYKAIHLGHIYGKGCDYEGSTEPPPVIEIYTVANEREGEEKLLQKLPYYKNIPVFADKWDFIEKYWNKNYRRFID